MNHVATYIFGAAAAVALAPPALAQSTVIPDTNLDEISVSCIVSLRTAAPQANASLTLRYCGCVRRDYQASMTYEQLLAFERRGQSGTLTAEDTAAGDRRHEACLQEARRG